jgi:hypothetical protein
MVNEGLSGHTQTLGCLRVTCVHSNLAVRREGKGSVSAVGDHVAVA